MKNKGTYLIENNFNYNEAYKRNLGLISSSDQEKLRKKTIGIIGMGGVGSNHLINFVRMGVENFKISDFDTYEIGNTNRQYGATTETYGKSKVIVMSELAKKINPNVSIKIYDKGINDGNIEEFIQGIDLYVDSIDAFEIKMRRKIFNRCYQSNIWAITAGPIGFSSAWISFSPKKMSFDQYFDISDDLNPLEAFSHFLAGLTPKAIQKKYMDYTKINFSDQNGPSVNSACFLCSAIVGAEAVKILLEVGNVKAAPHYHQFDPYQNIYILKKLKRGNKSFLQRFKIKKIHQFLEGLNPL